MTPAPAPPRLQVDLPESWWCVDLGGDLGEAAAPAVPSGGGPATGPAVRGDIERGALSYAAWLRDQGARVALLRPADDAVPAAICGGVFLLDPVPDYELYAALELDGDAVVLGDLAGLPVISHVRHESDGLASPLPVWHLTYFVCAPSLCVVIVFVAPATGSERRVVRELAQIVSTARVVHSDGGCPV
jgi:hypothetical protein